MAAHRMSYNPAMINVRTFWMLVAIIWTVVVLTTPLPNDEALFGVIICLLFARRGWLADGRRVRR